MFFLSHFKFTWFLIITRKADIASHEQKKIKTGRHYCYDSGLRGCRSVGLLYRSMPVFILINVMRSKPVPAMPRGCNTLVCTYNE